MVRTKKVEKLTAGKKSRKNMLMKKARGDDIGRFWFLTKAGRAGVAKRKNRIAKRKKIEARVKRRSVLPRGLHPIYVNQVGKSNFQRPGLQAASGVLLPNIPPAPPSRLRRFLTKLQPKPRPSARPAKVSPAVELARMRSKSLRNTSTRQPVSAANRAAYAARMRAAANRTRAAARTAAGLPPAWP